MWLLKNLATLLYYMQIVYVPAQRSRTLLVFDAQFRPKFIIQLVEFYDRICTLADFSYQTPATILVLDKG